MSAEKVEGIPNQSPSIELAQKSKNSANGGETIR